MSEETAAIRTRLTQISALLDAIEGNPPIALNLLIGGQSNAVAAYEPGDTRVMATVPNSCMIGVASADGLSVTLTDANTTQTEIGLSWVHMVNKLRTYHDKKYGITVCAEGSTTIENWATEPRITRLKNALANFDIDGVIWLQGESNDTQGFNQQIQDQMVSVITQCNAVKVVPWLINLCDHPYDNATYYAIALAQKYVVDMFPNVYWGIDASRMHAPDVSLRTVNRGNNEVHFVGDRKRVLGETMADRLNDVFALWP